MEQSASSIRTSRGVIQGVEALAIRYQAAKIGPLIAQYTQEGSIEVPGSNERGGSIITAVIGEEGCAAELHGVYHRSGAWLSGRVHVAPTRKLWLPHITVDASLNSDSTEGGPETFASHNPTTLAAVEHFTVVSEIVRRVSGCAGACTVRHSTVY